MKKQNYSGHTPKLLKSDFLMKYIYEDFMQELKSIDNFKNILLIPLGKAVEEVLEKLSEENIISENQILKGFPHPSGANVNRLAQLEQNKESLINQIRENINQEIIFEDK